MKRQFRINNYLKGRLVFMFEHLIEENIISLEKISKASHKVTIVEDKINIDDLRYLQTYILTSNREIKN